MQGIRKIKLITTIAAVITLLFTINTSNGQGIRGSSNIAFSPYTMYGIGDFIPLGTSSSMSMGGTGIGVYSRMEINYLNPASLAAIPQRTAIFSLGARGHNYYSKTPSAKTSYSSVDLTDLGFAVPLYRGIALGISLNPVTSVGFDGVMIDDSRNVIENIGIVRHGYVGHGGISQASVGAGFTILPGFAVGASMQYYFGNIERTQTREIIPVISDAVSYKRFVVGERLNFSSVGFNFGMQYSHRVGKANSLTLGVVFQPKRKLDPKTYEESMMYNTKVGIYDTIKYFEGRRKMDLPAKFGVGLSYASTKLLVAVDWTMQDWKDAFEINTEEDVKMRRQQEYRLGLSYTPNPSSLRSALLRWSYRIGTYYTQSYLVKNGYEQNDIGVTLGVEIPLKMGRSSKLSVGFNYGQRGTLREGQVKERYFKINAGISLFGGDLDRWFARRKFD